MGTACAINQFRISSGTDAASHKRIGSKWFGKPNETKTETRNNHQSTRLFAKS